MTKVTIKLHKNITAPEALKLFAIELFKTGKYSTGFCAELANVSYNEFLHVLSDNKISIFKRTKEDLLNEFENA